MTELERMRTPVKKFFEHYEKPKHKWGMQIMSAPMKVWFIAFLAKTILPIHTYINQSIVSFRVTD